MAQNKPCDLNDVLGSFIEISLTCVQCMAYGQNGRLFTCVQGHAICLKCYKNFRTSHNTRDVLCPLCQNPLGENDADLIIKTRIFLKDSIKKPCRYKHSGCSVKAFQANLAQHQTQCDYKQFKCPSAEISGCPFLGILAELRSHIIATSTSHNRVIRENVAADNGSGVSFQPVCLDGLVKPNLTGNQESYTAISFISQKEHSLSKVTISIVISRAIEGNRIWKFTVRGYGNQVILDTLAYSLTVSGVTGSNDISFRGGILDDCISSDDAAETGQCLIAVEGKINSMLDESPDRYLLIRLELVTKVTIAAAKPYAITLDC